MIRSKLFLNQFFISVGSIFVSVVVGTSILTFAVHILESRESLRYQSPSIFVNFVERESKGDLVASLKKLESYQGENDPFRLVLLDEKGAAIYPTNVHFPEIRELPKGVHQSIPQISLSKGPPPPVVITQLDHSPARYLLVKMTPPSKLPGIGFWFFPLSFITLVLMVLLGVGIAIAIIFRSLRATATQMDNVISELKKGNLKARFSMERDDEIGQAMERFNSMADEIEKLVEKLRLAENSRNQLLQELTHDLRTPVTSLQTIQGAIFKNVTMNADVAELAGLAEKEVEYLGSLVEDLLLLAQLTEPKFKQSKGLVDVLSLLEEECDTLAVKNKNEIELNIKLNVEQALVPGDEHLFRRLIRNTLENAFSYAEHKVEVEIGEQGGSIRVCVSDDGAGFSPEMLAKFGERRDQRTFRKAKGGKLSLGLGSVIMKSIVLLHGGKIHASNTDTGGARVEFTIPA